MGLGLIKKGDRKIMILSLKNYDIFFNLKFSMYFLFLIRSPSLLFLLSCTFFPFLLIIFHFFHIIYLKVHLYLLIRFLVVTLLPILSLYSYYQQQYKCKGTQLQTKNKTAQYLVRMSLSAIRLKSKGWD